MKGKDKQALKRAMQDTNVSSVTYHKRPLRGKYLKIVVKCSN